MKTLKTKSKMKPDVYSGLPALILAGMIAICTFALPVVVFSQTTEWTTYNVSNSQLPFDSIGPLVFDAQGNLWIGSGSLSPGSSDGGLAKFDGENWTVYYTSNSGLPCNNIHSLAFDGQGNLRIGTGVPLTPGRGGLTKFDGENWTVYNTSNSGLPSNFVSSLAFDDQGNLWIGTAGGGLAQFDGESWTVYHTSNSPLTWHMVTSLALDAQQNLWMGMCSAHTTTGGVARFDGENWLVFNQKNSGLPHVTATGLAFDRQGSTWIGTYGGGLAALRSWPVVDFNGDGVVDSADICIMVDYWGTNEPLCDIGPTPWGDGIVDVEDMKVLAEYLFGDIRSIAHFKFDEVKGNIANDSARNLDSTVYGEPEWRPKEGIIGGALQLDGFDDHIKTGFLLNPADGELSVFAWIKGGSPGQVIVSQVGGANWLCTDALEGNLMTNIRNPGRFGGPMLSQTNITDGNWHHIGLVWDGSKRTLYVDNVVVAEDTQNGLESSDSGLYIGTGKVMEPGSFWSGLIDDVRIYNRAISP